MTNPTDFQSLATPRDHIHRLIHGRRSIRSYQDRAISDELVQIMLEAAMAAPSACEADPWRFVVVRSRERLAELAEGLPNGKMLAHAALGIVVTGDLDAAWDKQLSYLLQDCSAAIENLLLAAHALGLGACWLGVHPREPRMTHLTRVLGLPATLVPVACLAIGYPAEPAEPRTRFDARFVHREQW